MYHSIMSIHGPPNMATIVSHVILPSLEQIDLIQHAQSYIWKCHTDNDTIHTTSVCVTLKFKIGRYASEILDMFRFFKCKYSICV